MSNGMSRALVLALVTALSMGCSASSSNTSEPEQVSVLEVDTGSRSYLAEWLINAEAVGADGPGFDFRYRETFDDVSGRYLIQSPDHLATQDQDTVIFCAAIFRSDPYCASTTRPEGTPPVLAYPLQLLRSWGPIELYDLAQWREIEVATRTDPDAWDRRRSVVENIAVECFTVVGETAAARTGFEVCFTDDDLHLVASVDLQGDLIYEIGLRVYERTIGRDAFATGLDEFIEAKPTLNDQLISLFPEVPAPRPTPTPGALDTEG